MSARTAGGRGERGPYPRCQFTLNDPPLIADGFARVAPFLLTMVIGWTLESEPRSAVCALIVAELPPNPTVPKLVSRPFDGPSMIHSHELRCALLDVCVV